MLEKPSGRLYYFPCPHWLDRASSDRVKLSLGQKPAKFTPAPRAALVEEEEEEDWQALVPAPAEAPSEAPAETASAGIGGSYTVSLMHAMQISTHLPGHARAFHGMPLTACACVRVCLRAGVCVCVCVCDSSKKLACEATKKRQAHTS